MRATSIAQATPPRNPFTLEYIARPETQNIRLEGKTHACKIRTGSPELDASKSITKNIDVGNEAQYLIRNTGSCHIMSVININLEIGWDNEDTS